MRKTVWGYNTAEVDETVGYLEAQTVKLERQVKQLSAELEKAQAALAEASAPEILQSTEKDDRITALRRDLEKAEERNRELTAQNESLGAKLAALSAEAAAKEPFEDIGSICKLAYSDIHSSKQKAKESIEVFLQEFWSEWKTYELRLAELSEQLTAKQQESRSAFISYADRILGMYESMSASGNDFDERFAEIVKSRSKIEQSLTDMLSELDRSFETESADSAEIPFTQDVAETPAEGGVSILAAIQKSKEHQAAKAQQTAAPQAETTQPAFPVSEAHTAPVEKEEMSISQAVNIRNII